MITYSTVCTLARIALTPIVVYLMLTHQLGAAWILFMIAAFTDLLDGALARWRNEHTFLGACLDPIADKLLIVAVFATLTFAHTPLFTLPVWFFITIVLRELCIVTGSAYLYLTGALHVKPSFLGKLTMFSEGMYIMWIFSCHFFVGMPLDTQYTLLWVVLLFSLTSLVQYAYRAYTMVADRT